MNYLSQDDFESDPLIEQWASLAQSAINDGSDPVRVNQKLRKALEDRGYDTAAIHMPIGDGLDEDSFNKVKDFWESANPKTKAAYKDAVVPDTVQELNTLPDSPILGHFDNVKSGSDSRNPTGLLASAELAGGSTFAHGVSGLADLYGSVTGNDEALNYAADLEAKQNALDEQNSSYAPSGVLGKAGNLVGTLGGGLLAGGGVGNITNIPRRDLDENMSPTQAWADTAVEGGKMAAMIASAPLEMAAPAVMPAIGAAGDYLHNAVSDEDHQVNPLDPTSRGLDTLFGIVGGGAARYHRGSIEAKINAARDAKYAEGAESSKVPETDLSSTGDPDLDSGIKAYTKFDEPPTQPDLFKPEQPEIPEGTQGELLPKQEEAPLPAEDAQAAPVEEAPAIDTSAMRNEGARLSARASIADEDMPAFSSWFGDSKTLDADNKPQVLYHGTSKDEDFQSFKMKDRGVWLTSDPKLASDYAKDNDSRGFRQEGWNYIPKHTADRVIPVYAKIENPYKWTPEDSANMSGKDYVRAQAARFREIKAAGHDGIDMGNGNWVALKDPNQLKSATGNTGAFSKSPKIHLDSAAAVNSNGNPIFRRQHNIASTVLDALDKNELTGEHVLNSIANNHNNLYTQSPELRSLASDAMSLAKRFGGLDNKIELYDPSNPVHNEIVGRNNKLGMKFEDSAAMYDPHTNTTLLNKQVGASTLVHETLHGITTRMIDLGERGMLGGQHLIAFGRFKRTLDSVKDHALSVAEKNKAGRLAQGMNPAEAGARFTRETYGLSNLHELVSEMYGSGIFRDFLKSIKLDDVKPTNNVARSVLSRARTAYDAIVKGLGNLMGLSPKAENAYDMLMSHFQDFASKAPDDLASAVSERTTRALRNRASAPDMSFLGEQAPARFDAAQSVDRDPTLVRPRGRIEAAIREATLAKGNRPVVRDATDSAENTRAAANTQSAAIVNAWKKYGKGVAKDDIAAVVDSTPNAREAFARIQETAPKLASALDDFRQSRHNTSLDIHDVIMSDPNASLEAKRQAAVGVKNRNTYTTDSYSAFETPGYSARKFAAAAKGNKQAVSDVNGAKDFLRSKWLPTNLDELNVKQLSDLYEMHTSRPAGELLKGVSKEDAPAILKQKVVESLDKIVNKDQWLDTAVKDVAGLSDADTSAIGRYYKGLRTTADVLSSRQRIPEALEKLWGRAEHPIIRAAKTLEKQGSTYAQLKAQADLAKQGIASGLLTDKAGTATHTTQLEGENLGPLRGLWTTPDTARAINSHAILSKGINDLVDVAIGDRHGKELAEHAIIKGAKAAIQIPRLNKANTILGNLINPVQDMFGSWMELASNGNISVPSMKRGFMTAARAVLQDSKTSVHPDVERMIKLGLADANPIGDLRKSPRAQSLRKLMADLEGHSNPMATVKGWVEKGKIPMRLYTDLYGATHAWAKYANFFNEKAFWENHSKRNNLGWSEEKIDKHAADIINSTNLSMSRSPKIFKATDYVGATLLAKYGQQALVNPLNNLAIGTQHVLEGMRTGDIHLAMHGAQRLGGTGLYLTKANAITASILKAGLGLGGLALAKLNDNDPRKKFIDTDEFLASGDQYVASDPAHPESGEAAVNVDRPNPFGPAVQTVQRLYAAIGLMGTDRNAAEQQAKIALEDIIGMFHPNSGISRFLDVLSGRQSSLARSNPDWYQKQLQTLVDAGLSPKNADRTISSESIVVPATVNRVLSSKTIPGDSTAMKTLVGSGLGMKFDVTETTSKYLGAKSSNDIKAAQAPFMSYISKPIDVSEEDVDKAFKKGMSNLVEPYDKLVAAVNAAKAQGKSEREVAMTLLSRGVDKKLAGMVYNNKPVPAALMLGDPEAKLLQMVKDEPDEERRKRLIEIARKKVRIIQNLIVKYKNVTMDELRNE